MPLDTHVQERYSLDRLIGYTNPQTQATVLDLTRLARAVTDVEADFEVHAQVVYDDTDARHVSVGVEGVVAKLMLRLDQAGREARERHDAYVASLRDLSRVSSRGRQGPRIRLQDPDRPVIFDPPLFDGLVFDRPRRRDQDID